MNQMKKLKMKKIGSNQIYLSLIVGRTGGCKLFQTTMTGLITLNCNTCYGGERMKREPIQLRVPIISDKQNCCPYEEPFGYIYKITNKVNGNYYITS